MQQKGKTHVKVQSYGSELLQGTKSNIGHCKQFFQITELRLERAW